MSAAMKTSPRSGWFALAIVFVLTHIAPVIQASDDPLGDSDSIASMAPVIERHYCAERLPEELELPAVNIGCHLIDCCIGCPALAAPWDLGAEIEIKVSGDLARSLKLKILNFDQSQVDGLSLENASSLGDQEIGIDAATARIRPPSSHNGAIMIEPVLIIDRRRSDSPPENTTIEFSVLRADSVFQAQALSYAVGAAGCGSVGSLPDSTTCLCGDLINLENNSGNDPSNVIFDGHTEFGCLNDIVLLGIDSISLGNVFSPVTCRNEVFVLSPGDAVTVLDHNNQASWNTWTNAHGNDLDIDLSPDDIPLPLNVVIAMPLVAERESRKEDAVEHIEDGQDIFDEHSSGIQIEADNEFHILDDNAKIDLLAQMGSDGYSDNDFTCTERVAVLDAVKAIDGAYDADRLNIYYVDKDFTGWHLRLCNASGETDGESGRIIFIGELAKSMTLLHEIGHALYLKHVGYYQGCSYTSGCTWDLNSDGIGDFGTTNIMWPGVDGRDQLSAGQMIRSSLEPKSLLNSGHYRGNQPVRNCPRRPVNAACPWIGLKLVKP